MTISGSLHRAGLVLGGGAGAAQRAASSTTEPTDSTSSFPFWVIGVVAAVATILMIVVVLVVVVFRRAHREDSAEALMKQPLLADAAVESSPVARRPASARLSRRSTSSKPK